MEEDGCATQLIDGTGNFNVAGLDHFANSTSLVNCGHSYTVVAIMGRQSSGKSTLLNHLFGTNFKVMDAYMGRSQTTKGIWIEKAVDIKCYTIVMDLEGADGRERGEDDTAFEKQSALFALVISDIVLINMWCNDIGCHHSANKPILSTVFQVMLSLSFVSPRKTTLLFVIRDKTKTPIEILETDIRKDTQEIWDTISKPEAYKNTSLAEFFNVDVTALSSYEEKAEQFKEEVDQLRKRFVNSISPGGLAGERWIPASRFSGSAQEIWEVIKQNKDLDLPALKVMVATFRCEEIAHEKYLLASDEVWLKLEKPIQTDQLPRFGEKLSSILGICLFEYDNDTIFYDEGVRNVKREQLKLNMLELMHSAFNTMVEGLHSCTLGSFKIELRNLLDKGEEFSSAVRKCTEVYMREFDLGCADPFVQEAGWDVTQVRDKLCHDIACVAKLLEVKARYKEQLEITLTGLVALHFETGEKDTWDSIRNLLRRETDAAVSSFCYDIAGFESDQLAFDLLVHLRDYARSMVREIARKEAGKILTRMNNRFETVFNNSCPSAWYVIADIRKIAKAAHVESLNLLAIMAVIRLDEGPDNIEKELLSFLFDRSIGPSGDPLRIASTIWTEVPLENTLITPAQCKSLWRQFKAETEPAVVQAISAQEQKKHLLKVLGCFAGMAGIGGGVVGILGVQGVASAMTGLSILFSRFLTGLPMRYCRNATFLMVSTAIPLICGKLQSIWRKF